MGASMSVEREILKLTWRLVSCQAVSRVEYYYYDEFALAKNHGMDLIASVAANRQYIAKQRADRHGVHRRANHKAQK